MFIRRLSLLAAAALWPALGALPGQAADALPYATRTQGYGAWGATVRGDIRTVGMAGAALGLADTFIASSANPAGLSMTLKDGDVTFASNSIRDAAVQEFDHAMPANSVGAAISSYPWGFSFGTQSAFNEGQPYRTGPVPRVSTRDFRIGASRLFFANRLSLGGTLNLGRAELRLDEAQAPGSGVAHHPYALGATFGVLYQLPGRWLLGTSYSLPMHYAVNGSDIPTPALPGFHQPIQVPETFGLGLGWIPNRYFRADFTLLVVGRTPSAALLASDETGVGRHMTVQPRLGASYVIADFSEFRATAYGGMYYEESRIEGYHGRLHGTGGLEVKPWILSFGWGIDVALDYRNYLVSAGVDVIKTMEKLELIPKPSRPASAQLLPRVTTRSDEGLARPLVRNWRPEGPPIDPIQLGLEIPGKLQKKLESASDAITGIFESAPKVQKPPKQKKTTKRKTKPKKKPAD